MTTSVLYDSMGTLLYVFDKSKKQNEGKCYHTEVIVMTEKDIKTNSSGELRKKFTPGQTVRVITKVNTGMNRSVELEPDNQFAGKIGIITSVTGFGHPIYWYDVAVTFNGEDSDMPPIVFNQDELETLSPKFIKVAAAPQREVNESEPF